MGHSAEELASALRQIDLAEVGPQEPLRAFGTLQELASAHAEDSAAREALTVLSNVAGMMLKPDRWESPYLPAMQFGNRRTWLPEDLTDVHRGFLSYSYAWLPSGALRAQVIDVLFVSAVDRDERYKLASESVNAWIGVGLHGELNRAEEQGWRRAVEIALRYRFTEKVTALVDLAMETIRLEQPRSAWQIARALHESGTGREHADEIVERLRNASATVEDLGFQREILEQVRSWALTNRDSAVVAEVEEQIGDLWWEEAKQRKSSSHFMARDCFGNAYNEYKRVERSRRSSRMNKRLARLPRKIREEGELALEEMHAVESDPIDLTMLRDQVDEVLKEEDSLRAMAAWFARVPLESVQQAHATAKQSMRENPLSHLFSHTTVAADGRTVQHSASARGHGDIPGDVWSEMLRQWELKVGILAQGYIWPALVELSTRHKFNHGDFALLVRSSAFIPPEQERHYVTALHNGYYGRLSESIFMLAPVVEACVRACLKRAGIETRNIRADDTEIEPGLSALMELDGVDEALTPDLAWNIRALYCGPLGPNLRNRVAHGLLSESESNGAAALFAWWLALRLAFVPFFNGMMADSSEPQSGSSTERDPGAGQTPPHDDSEE
ncbi:DUF4209 domain-containing protein [Propionibacterium freudenreichii]|uniref:DUF4209 domain-containing protein n=2 Tax=Propionibacterium freudenreichii TaxID=1744 RepID=UPI000542DF75|nr:DUF4209 domain-containing protein [Propionibacterium freudenreichii]MCT3013523.1 DUF4209 domain-containing protein [Propionibacterium freudenreichii]MCT3018132.1 DUF4209 domain-containing protein [Propionibacterium freudenreichii]MDK9320291.1 DUF4209 domain-containing protein [Propionibacterium freudenreichii]MDK9343797.1 DUF4209 domain-containing protein [Propionibacterium freudenreichii]MDK9612034.1 DUF4209 domain-containing protein [Propionibacterium freudenreichii]